MGRRKRLAELDELAARHGFGPGEITGGSHLKFTHRSGAVVFHASTPSDRRSLANFRARLRRVARAVRRPAREWRPWTAHAAMT